MTKDINLDCGHPYGQDGEEAPVASLPLAPVEPTSAGPAWTAGPWRVESGYVQNIWAEGGWVAAVGGCGMSCAAPDIEQQEANMRLISAAPDLYEALAYVLSAHGEQLTDAFDQAHKALAKARGQ